MHPRDPVYPLTAAVERVKETIPDQDADGWLGDAIAAGRIGWADLWMEDRDRMGIPLPIDILPMAAIMEAPGLKIDWSNGMAEVRRRYRGVVECSVVVSRDDLDLELAKITASPEATDRQPDGEQSQLSRREQGKQGLRAKRRQWHDRSKELTADNKSLRPIEIARIIAKEERRAGNTKANVETIKRRLNEPYPE